MHGPYEKYTLADMVSLAHQHRVTYHECAEILEEELQRRFPQIKPDEFYPIIKQKAFDAEDYCYRLIQAGKRLEEMLRN